MEIVLQTPTYLSLRSRPWRIWITSAVLVILGLVGFVLLNHLTVLSCDRSLSPAQCELVRSNVYGVERLRIPLTELKQADLESNRANGNSQRIVLTTNQGSVPLTPYFTRGFEDLQGQVTQINTFLQEPTEQRLQIQDDKRWTAMLAAITFCGMGLGIGLSPWAQAMGCWFDKEQGQFALNKRSLLRGQVIERPLQAITGVELETSKSERYRVSLALASGEHLSLTPYEGGGKDRQALASQISQFLDLPIAPLPLSDPSGHEWTTDDDESVRIPGQDAEVAAPMSAEAAYKAAVQLAMQGQTSEAIAQLEALQQRLMASGQTTHLSQVEATLTQLKRSLAE